MATFALPPSIYQDAFYSTLRAITTSVVNSDFDNIDMKNGKIINVAEPIYNSDAATKYYVDTHSGGGGGNLIGPISAIAGVTSITSKTGTGTKFVVDNGPTLISPNIGVATGTSLNMSGNISIGGQILSSNTTQTTSSITGAIITSGGISAQKNIFSGGTCSAIDFISTSDRRLKSNIKNIDRGDIEKFLKVKGYTYNLKNDDTSIKYGVMAQDLEDVGLGALVDDTSEYKKVSYQSLIPLMIETIKIMEHNMEEYKLKFAVLENIIECNNSKFILLERSIEKLERKLRKSDSMRKKRRSLKK